MGKLESLEKYVGIWENRETHETRSKLVASPKQTWEIWRVPDLCWKMRKSQMVHTGLFDQTSFPSPCDFLLGLRDPPNPPGVGQQSFHEAPPTLFELHTHQIKSRPKASQEMGILCTHGLKTVDNPNTVLPACCAVGSPEIGFPYSFSGGWPWTGGGLGFWHRSWPMPRATIGVP